MSRNREKKVWPSPCSIKYPWLIYLELRFIFSTTPNKAVSKAPKSVVPGEVFRVNYLLSLPCVVVVVIVGPVCSGLVGFIPPEGPEIGSLLGS